MDFREQIMREAVILAKRSDVHLDAADGTSSEKLKREYKGLSDICLARRDGLFQALMIYEGKDA